MVFSSAIFLVVFLPATLLVHALLGRKLKNPFLLLASILFFAWAAPRFVFIALSSVILDFFLAGLMNREQGRLRRLLMLAAVMINLGLLVYYKYAGFLMDNLNAALQSFGFRPAGILQVVLPVGISFFTFQKIAYVMDVYRGGAKPFTSPWDYALFILFFPKLTAGPIVRCREMAEELADRRKLEGADYKLSGFFRFVIGLSKKVLIANVLSEKADLIFSLQPQDLTTPVAWVGILAYSFQIYFDFSGYTDMALGISRMLGFRIPENFNNPYVSGSITEFWRRWHMTLSRWFRDYMFLPLAYVISRKMPRERYFGMRADKIIYIPAALVTMSACGLWHGASWTFIAWGAYHGFFMVLDHLFLLKRLKKAGKIVSVAFTFVVIMLGWVLFRSATFGGALHYLRTLFSFNFAESEVYFDGKFLFILGLALFFSFWGIRKKTAEWQERFYLGTPKWPFILVMSVVSLLLVAVCLGDLVSTGLNPFIYFRF